MHRSKLAYNYLLKLTALKGGVVKGPKCPEPASPLRGGFTHFTIPLLCQELFLSTLGPKLDVLQFALTWDIMHRIHPNHIQDGAAAWAHPLPSLLVVLQLPETSQVPRSPVFHSSFICQRHCLKLHWLELVKTDCLWVTLVFRLERQKISNTGLKDV